MTPSQVESIVEQVKALPPDEQIQVAEALDRLTWSQRWRRVCERIEKRSRSMGEMTDQQIDDEVRTVRREKPLSERSSIPPS